MPYSDPEEAREYAADWAFRKYWSDVEKSRQYMRERQRRLRAEEAIADIRTANALRAKRTAKPDRYGIVGKLNLSGR